MRKLNLLNTGRPVSLTSMPGSPTGGVSEASGETHSDLGQCSPPLTASTSAQLQQLHNHCPPGTVVFLQPEQTLVFKVDIGYHYIVIRLLLVLTKTQLVFRYAPILSELSFFNIFPTITVWFWP